MSPIEQVGSHPSSFAPLYGQSHGQNRGFAGKKDLTIHRKTIPIRPPWVALDWQVTEKSILSRKNQGDPLTTMPVRKGRPMGPETDGN